MAQIVITIQDAEYPEIQDAFDFFYKGRTGRVDADGNPLPDISKPRWMHARLLDFIRETHRGYKLNVEAERAAKVTAYVAPVLSAG